MKKKWEESPSSIPRLTISNSNQYCVVSTEGTDTQIQSTVEKETISPSGVTCVEPTSPNQSWNTNLFADSTSFRNVILTSQSGIFCQP